MRISLMHLTLMLASFFSRKFCILFLFLSLSLRLWCLSDWKHTKLSAEKLNQNLSRASYALFLSLVKRLRLSTQHKSRHWRFKRRERWWVTFWWRLREEKRRRRWMMKRKRRKGNFRQRKKRGRTDQAGLMSFDRLWSLSSHLPKNDLSTRWRKVSESASLSLILCLNTVWFWRYLLSSYPCLFSPTSHVVLFRLQPHQSWSTAGRKQAKELPDDDERHWRRSWFSSSLFGRDEACSLYSFVRHFFIQCLYLSLMHLLNKSV